MNENQRKEYLIRIGTRIKQLRIDRKMSQDELAKKSGYTSRSTINKIELGINDVSQSKLKSIAEALNVTVNEILCWDDHNDSHDIKLNHGVVINVLGRVAAGIPIEAIEDIVDTEEITEEMAKTGSFFGLQIHGDSMEPRMRDGDVVIVRQQNDAESDEIVIALVNGDEATCKRLKKYANGIVLLSTNPKYEPLYFSTEEIESKPVRIIGKVVELRAKF